MQDDNVNSEISTELREIKDELRKLEKQSRFGSDDQFFFAFSFSLLILFLTLPLNDLVIFLQTFGLTGTLAASTANGIRTIGIVTALIASFMRYYGTMCGERGCKVKRFQSIIALLTGFWFFIFIIGVNSLSGLTLVTSLVAIPLGIAALIAVYGGLFFLEKRLLVFFAAKNLIQKSDVTPVASPFFVFICTSYYFSFVVAVLVSLIAPSLATVASLVVFLSAYYIQSRLYSRALKRRKRHGFGKSPKLIKKTLVN